MGATNVNSTTYDKQIAVPQTLLLTSELHGRMRMAKAVWTSTAIEAGSTVKMIKMPKGAKLLFGYLASGDQATSVTLGLGVGDTDVSLLAQDAGFATGPYMVEFPAAASFANFGLDIGEKILTIVTAGVTLTASVATTLIVFYVID